MDTKKSRPGAAGKSQSPGHYGASAAAHQFRMAMIAVGLEPPEHVEPGKLHRFPSAGKARSNKAAWCRMFPDGRGGCFGDWSTGTAGTWQADRAERMTPAEQGRFRAMVAEARAVAAAELVATQAHAARMAARLWAKAERADPEHPYLVRKRVQPYIARQLGERLVLPIVTARGELASLQFIHPDGGKRMLTGGAKRGRIIPVRWLGRGAPIVVCEGFATGATLAELLPGRSVAAAIDAGNLGPACAALRSRFPRAEMGVYGDDDRRTPGNPGRTKANEAARACGGKVWFPPWNGTEPEDATDANDLAIARGLLGKGVSDARA